VSTHTTAFYCSAEWHLSKLGKYPALVHALILRVQTDDNDFFGSNEQIAEYFDADEKTIRRILDVLADTGFVEVIEERAGESTIRRALTHKEWAAKYPGCCCIKKENYPSQSLGVASSQPLPVTGSTPSQSLGVHPSQSFPEPLPMTGTQVSVEVAVEVSEKSPKGSSRNAAHSLSAIPSLSQAEQQKPSSEENHRPWVFKIWKATTGTTLNVRKTDLARLERFIEKHGEEKSARAWFAYVNAEPRPYNLEPVEMAVKRQYKNGQEWLEGAEDESKITRLPLAAFFAVTPGYIVAADEPLDKYGLDKFNKASGNCFERVAV
jgi:hypothetical protein